MKRFMTRGFTLIEMLVVVGIIVVVSGVVLASNNRFSGQTLLLNLAYDIALSMRQAQIYGVAVKKFERANGTSVYAAGYGMHFARSSPTTYVLFADTSDNGVYNSGELVQSTDIGSGYRVSKICATALDCAAVNGSSSVDIVFRRPESDAWISRAGQTCTPAQAANCQSAACIFVESPHSDNYVILVRDSGQISVRGNCPV